MHSIIPGILEQEWGEIDQKIKACQSFAKVIHIDLLDGKFAPNTSFFDPKPFKKYSQDILFELHMMVEEPEQYIESWAKEGFRRFIGHVEHMSDQASFVTRAEEVGEVGLALDLMTDLSEITVSHLDLDTVLIMTVKAGFSGQTFSQQPLDKVKLLAREELFPIEIDGGINNETIIHGLSAEATRFVATSYLFGSDNPESRYQTLLKAS